MHFLVKPGCLLLLVPSLLAQAAAVTVTTRSTGSTTTDDTVLRALGLEPAGSATTLPYALTLSSRFDPEANRANWAVGDGGTVLIDYRIGEQSFRYEGRAGSSAGRYDQSIDVDAYEHGIAIVMPASPEADYRIHFSHTLYSLPRGTTETLPLRPYHADEADGLQGYYTVRASPGNPEVPLSWEMSSSIAAFSTVQVTVVPEPAGWTLLAGGLLSLGLHRRLAGHGLRRRGSASVAFDPDQRFSGSVRTDWSCP